MRGVPEGIPPTSFDIMRTTVSITDELLAAAKLRARELGVSLGEVIDAYVFGSHVSGHGK